MWWNFNKRKERRAGIVATVEQQAVFDEATQSLREGLPVERVVFYEPDDEDAAKDPSTLHIAVITDHYPSHEEYRAALDALSSVAAKHNVELRPLFSTCKDWENSAGRIRSVAANVNQAMVMSLSAFPRLEI